MSLKTARKKYNVFLVDYISKNTDWTPTKKYTEKMCQFINPILLVNGTNDEIFNHIQTILSGFKLFDRYYSNFEIRDINQYQTLDDFLLVIENYITNFTDNRIRSMFKVEGKLNPGLNIGNFNDYNIVKISSFNEASKYSGVCPWCVTKADYTFLEYTSSNKQFYFALKKDYELVRKKREIDAPLDEYGLSMLALRVSINGNIDVTTRWNHEYGENTLTNNLSELNKLFNIEDIRVLLKPKTTNNQPINIDKYIEISKLRLNMNVPFENVFDKIYVHNFGYVIVSLYNKENFIDVKGNKLISDVWFDGVYNFNPTGGVLFAIVNIKNKVNLIKIDGTFISDLWFDDIIKPNNKTFFFIKNKDLFNTMNMNGEILNDIWFKEYVNNSTHYFRVKINNEYEYLDVDGKYLKKTQNNE